MKQGKVAWSSPSNLALIKYWGKTGNQMPMNPSLSITLNNSVSITEVEWYINPGQKEISFEFLFEGKRKPTFDAKLNTFFQRVLADNKEFAGLHCKINSKNTFPHSAGIASSASGMSAMALCLTNIYSDLLEKESDSSLNINMASHLARLGSGSACRSVFPFVSQWGKTSFLEQSRDEHAIPLQEEIHEEIKSWKNYIFLVSTGEKTVSSSAGHELMEGHHYRAARIEQANQNIEKLIPAMKSLDYSTIISIVEEEALSLHGLMMSSRPSYCLLEPDSLDIIHKVRQWREKSGLPVFFSIDAGPNIHLLFPSRIKDEVKEWIKTGLNDFNERDRIVFDMVGSGPNRLV